MHDRKVDPKVGFSFFVFAFLPCLIGWSSAMAATISPTGPQIRYTGRFDFSTPDKPRFDWPASVIEAAFTGTSLTVLLSGGDNDFNVFVDGVRKPNLVLKGGATSHVIAGPFAPGAHQLRLTKRTEGFNGVVTFSGLQVDDNQGAASLPPRLQHRILFVGDSYSAGYGVEANILSCADKRPYDNADTAFAALTARALNAEYSVQAISGIGMAHNFGDATPQSSMPFPPYFDRTLFNQAQPKFTYASWVPEVIVIALGNNDFSTGVKPSQEQYTTAYTAFHATVRAAYPQAHILCLAFAGDGLQTTYIPAIVNQLTTAGDTRIAYFAMPPLGNNAAGCDYHPNVAGQQKYAEALIPEVRKWLGTPTPLAPPSQGFKQKRRPSVGRLSSEIFTPAGLVDASGAAAADVLGRSQPPKAL
jgi:lysophospholipase L1-like esterase